ncbi:thioesterase II family protein [Roseospira visakhapatnamensis]|uniref:Thioesterase component of yersiniabactin synthetase n=1 Tax=Roseospira visakhapatnamensis TaxID=390880 RepID=A0A7W6WAM5_9PROT|nr:alpha/beta fold hydrolase [Roseospira visakhapatnamensis]MBB4267124.1 thioesterase component of yersiniabactin synthetase [Roseospira visakhapatnamensis]
MTPWTTTRWTSLWPGDGTGAAERRWVLFCPFAGGSGSAFSAWRAADVCPFPSALATYPGRDQRRSEPPRRDVPGMAQDIATELLTRPDRVRDALILVGHSMGAQVAFEICKALEAADVGPAALVLSGCQAPHLRARRLLSGRSDRDFIDTLIRIGGCVPEVRDNADLLSVFLPLLRADFEATERYILDNDGRQATVRTPSLMLWGSLDDEADAGEVRGWADWVRGETAFVEVAGDHFYPTRRPRAFCQAVLDFSRARVPALA